MTSRITAIYRVRDSAANIEARAKTIAVEQSVEMPVSAITKRSVLDGIVGEVEDISDLGGGTFEIRIGLAVSTTGLEAGQMLNMLFGNSSIHADIVLHDAIFPDEVVRAFAGPHHGIEGLRARVGAKARALTCSALKPQGFTPAELADSRRSSRAAASTTSRTITASPIRPTAPSPSAYRPSPRPSATRKPMCRRAICRASPAISTSCAARSRSCARRNSTAC